MPPRKSTRKPRKSTVAKVKRTIGKTKKTMAKKNMDTKFVQCIVEGPVTPKQGVAVSNYLYGFVPLLDENSGQGVTSTDRFKQHASMYDRVRVNSIRVTLTPKANTFDASQAQNDSSLTLTGNGALYTILDRDGPAPWVAGAAGTMFGVWSQYPSCKVKSLLKKHVRTYSIKYPRGIWLDTADLFADTTLLNRLGLEGGVSFYAENLVEDVGEVFNEPWGIMRIEYNCVFEGSKPVQTSVAEDGTITIKPIEVSYEDAATHFTPFGDWYPIVEE